MMPISDNLPQLRDIHLPDGVSVWPLAYGWWVVMAAIVIALVLFFAIKYLRRKSKKLYALYLLKNIALTPIVPSAAAISEILRRICIYKYPSAISLSGEHWAEFLFQHSKTNLTPKAKQLLLESPYMPEETKNYDKQDITDLLKFCSSWIGENL